MLEKDILYLIIWSSQECQSECSYMRTNVGEGHIISDNSRNVNNRTVVGKNVGEGHIISDMSI